MKNYILSILIIIPFFVLSQTDEKVISDIYTNSLTKGQSYNWLDHGVTPHRSESPHQYQSVAAGYPPRHKRHQ